MITPWTIYWITRLDAINSFLSITYSIITSALVIISIIWLARSLSDDYEKPDLMVKPWKALLVAFFINSLGWFVPTTREMAAIIIIPKIANNQELQKIPVSIVALANEWLEKLKPEEKK